MTSIHGSGARPQCHHHHHVVERLVNRLKQFRRVATRYEKRAVNYLAMLTIPAITLWL
jgi:transposase